MIKAVFNKLLIAAISGALILAFVYFKDNYLSEGDKDAELLNEVTYTQDVKPENTKENEKPGELVIEVENTEDNEPVQQTIASNTQPEQETVSKPQSEPTKSKKDITFDDFQKSMMKNSTADDAFAELERETNK